MTWCLVHCQGGRELFVVLLLKRSNHEIYFPQVRERDRKRPMFPNYLFARLVDGQWSDIRWTPRVLNVILDRQAKLETAVASLRNRESGGYVRLPRKPKAQIGDPVRIISGSFEGRMGWYDGQGSAARVRVLLELLGRKVPLELNDADVQISTPHMLRHGNS